MRERYDTDAEKRRTDYWHEDGDGWVFESRYDTYEIQVAAKAARNAVSDYGPSRWKNPNPGCMEMHHVAYIPQPVVEQLIRERGWGWMRDKKNFKAWLNDPDNSLWRTKPGRI